MKKTVTTVLCMTMVVCNTLKSQENMKTTSEKMPFAYVDAKTIKSHNSNPFGLVYSDAIKENVKGNVNILPITYDLNGLKISANIYVPATYDAAKSYPALVVAHPNGGVKEQVSGLYSQRMAEAGYICLAFDAAYQVLAKENRATRTNLLTVLRTSAVRQIFCCSIRVWMQIGSESSVSAVEAATR